MIGIIQLASTEEQSGAIFRNSNASVCAQSTPINTVLLQ